MIKVELVHDYTKYNDELKKGTTGYALETPEEQIKRASKDRFVKVVFEGITVVDVLWKGLNIVDEKYLANKAEEKRIYLSQMSSAKDIIYTIGPKDGFRSLEFNYINHSGESIHLFIDDKNSAKDYLDYFNENNIKYNTIQLEKKEREKK